MYKALSLTLMLLFAACNSTATSDVPEDDSGPRLEGASIGAPFVLTGSDGKQVDSKQFDGKYRMIYFGYTYCPDVCPVDLQKLMAGLKLFEKSDPDRATRIQPLFITLDPERDTPEVMRRYSANFHSRLLGLTGTPAEIDKVTEAFAVYHRKEEGSGPDDYLVAHSQTPYLMDPRGKPIDLLPVDDPATEADEGSPAEVAATLDRWVK